MEKNNSSLFDRLKSISHAARVPFHMPGHMREKYPHLVGEDIDFTEIDGLDDLHAPTGILAEAMDHAASVFGARRTFFLTCGSTCGILSAVRATVKRGETMIVARNCHKSVYNAASLAGARLEYVLPPVHPLGFPLDIDPCEIEAAIDSAISRGEKVSAVVLPSPTYDGVISDIAGIAAVCHKRNVPLIVDSAHGAHLGFLDKSIKSAVECGADIVVMSLHKTMPSLTQTALLHISGELIDADAVSEALSVFETSSPSYILMASADGCVRSYSDRDMFARWSENIREIKDCARRSAARITVPDAFAFDESKLIVSSCGYSGTELAGIMRNTFNIEPEAVSQKYVLLMTGAGTTAEHVDALKRFFADLEPRECSDEASAQPSPALKSVMTMSEAFSQDTVIAALESCAGGVAAEMLTPYPPGVPLVVPGEVISPELIEYVRSILSSGVRVTTPRGEYDGKLRVVRAK